MRRVTVLVLLVCLCGLANAAITHRYDFTSDPNDLIGTADGVLIEGTGTGALTPYYADGQLYIQNGAWENDEPQINYVDLPNGMFSANSATNGEATYEFWATYNGDLHNDWQSLFTAGYSAAGEGLTPPAGSAYYYPCQNLLFSPRSSNATVTFLNRFEASDARLHGDSIMPIDEETHVVMVVNDNDLTVHGYINGVRITGSNETLLNPVAAMAGLDNNNFLARGPWSDAAYRGSFNEFRMYDTVMTDDQVMANYLAGPNHGGLTPTSPANGEVDIAHDQDLNLMWEEPIVFGSVTVSEYHVYFGTDVNTVTLATTGYTTVTAPATGTVIGNAQLNSDSEYFWRVDYVTSEPNIISSDVFSFETVPSVPVLTGPEDAGAQLTESAEFVVDITSVPPVTSGGIVWYKYVDGTSANDIALSDDADYDITFETISGTEYKTTLTVLNVQEADAGDYYCIVQPGAVTSDTATLWIKRLVAHYAFETAPTVADANVLDSSGQGNTGTAVNLPILATGVVGNAFEFDGTNQYVDLPRSVENDFTVAVWIKTTHAGGTEWYKGDQIIGAEVGGTADDWALAVSSGGYAHGGVRNVGDDVLSTTAVNDDNWHYLVMTRDQAAGEIKLYVDGTEEDTDTCTTAVLDDMDYLRIGNRYGSVKYPFFGQIDEVKLFNYVLTVDDIALEYYLVTGVAACTAPVANDLNDDCIVNLGDLAVLAGSWLDCNLYPAAACN